MKKRPPKRCVYNVDFEAIERGGKTSNKLHQEIIEKMIAISEGKDQPQELTSRQKVLWDLVQAAFENLTDKQKQVLNWTFGLNDSETLGEQAIADRLKISQPSVHELKDRALAAIKRQIDLNSDLLKE